MTNTATVTAPEGVEDTNLANNSATDTDTLTPQADLSITKSDGSDGSSPGGAVPYAIVFANAGFADVLRDWASSAGTVAQLRTALDAFFDGNPTPTRLRGVLR